MLSLCGLNAPINAHRRLYKRQIECGAELVAPHLNSLIIGIFLMSQLPVRSCCITWLPKQVLALPM